MQILPYCTTSFHYFQHKMLFLWICCYSFKHRINTCHNSCCKTSINCQAIKRQALTENERRNWHRPIEATKMSSVWEDFESSHEVACNYIAHVTTDKWINNTRSICHESATDIDWNDCFMNVIASLILIIDRRLNNFL